LSGGDLRQNDPVASRNRSYSRATMSYTKGKSMTTLTIRLDAKLDKDLDRIARSTGRTKSEIAREALRRQVALARFRELRKKALPFAEAQGLVTDEDVFRALA
jgi:predicted transcriptional regulator